MGRSLGDSFAVFAADDWELRWPSIEDLLVPARVIPVVVCIHDGGKVKRLGLLFENG